jgi:hypothetical protein
MRPSSVDRSASSYRRTSVRIAASRFSTGFSISPRCRASLAHADPRTLAKRGDAIAPRRVRPRRPSRLDCISDPRTPAPRRHAVFSRYRPPAVSSPCRTTRHRTRPPGSGDPLQRHCAGEPRHPRQALRRAGAVDKRSDLSLPVTNPRTRRGRRFAVLPLRQGHRGPRRRARGAPGQRETEARPGVVPDLASEGLGRGRVHAPRGAPRRNSPGVTTYPRRFFRKLRTDVSGLARCLR